MLPVVQWSQKEVGDWLVENGFESYKHEFCEKHGIDGPSLLTLSEEDLKGPPMGFQRLGDIKRIMICVRQLQLENRTSIHHLSVPELRGHLNPPDFQRMRSSADSTHSGDDTDSMAPRSSNRRSHKLEPEYIKCLISFIYMMSVFLLTAFVMVIVHDRVPDVKRYPPLPDIVLDNLPYIPWAFEVCELSGVTLLLIWSTTLFFHKHRFILMRRMFSMTGTIFLLRCVTMLITSLSVPGTHLDCQPVLKGNYAGPWSVIERALTIWRGCGMSLQGVRSCGDYMFSGHTVIVTILNFFITEYTPRRMYWVHTTTWILNIFAVFFILAAHEHYSIDVFIAFYITSRLFLYYHSLANNRALTQGDRRRTRVWFPLFSYFESSIAGIVPNEYEWPFQIIQKYLKYPAEKRKTT